MVCLTAGVASPVAAEQPGDAAKPEPGNAVARQMLFDIPAQPLVSALESYGAVSGFQVVYDATLAKGRRSSDVRGALTPEVALRALLAGTGLVPRYMSADGVVLALDPLIGNDGNSAPRAAITRYYGRIQAGLRRAFCSDALLASASHRFAVGLWIAPSGIVARSVLLDTTGNADRDGALEAAIRGIHIDEPPPAGFDQPVIMTVSPDTQNDCAFVQRQRAGR